MWYKRVLLASLVMALCTLVFAQLPAGIPRNETLIVDSIHGRWADITNANAWVPGVQIGSGLHNLLLDALWYVDHGTGKFINALAADSPTYSSDFTVITIPLRRGIFWSDGVEFTAEDVAFTLEYLKANAGLQWHSILQQWLEKATAVDRYTVQITLKKPNPRFHYVLTCDIWWGLYIMPKHIFEKVKDPLSFRFWPPVSLGPYEYLNHDPDGYWMLFKRRDDWNRTSVGMVAGMPGPKYILFAHHGPEEKKIAAQARHELDWIFDVTTEGWYALKSMNPYSQSWFKEFPYAFFHDPTARGIYFNTTKPPYDKAEVRWALTLAINMYDVMISAYDAIQILVPTHAGLGMAHFELYHKGMLPWLKEFELPFLPGYKPFDAELPRKLREYAVAQKYIAPNDPRNPIDIWGPGWWRYDPKTAEKILQSLGFQKIRDRWHLPDGTPWKIVIVAPDYELDATRLAFAVAEQWQDFGIDVRVDVLASAPFWDAAAYGHFEVGAFWSSAAQGGIIPDLWYTHNWWHKNNILPIGQYATANNVRWSNDKVSSILDEMASLHPDDPKMIELSYELLKILVVEMPIVPAVDCKKFSPFDTYYWTNFPNGENPYWSFLFWCGGFKWITPHLKPTGR